MNEMTATYQYCISDVQLRPKPTSDSDNIGDVNFLASGSTSQDSYARYRAKQIPFQLMTFRASSDGKLYAALPEELLQHIIRSGRLSHLRQEDKSLVRDGVTMEAHCTGADMLQMGGPGTGPRSDRDSYTGIQVRRVATV